MKLIYDYNEFILLFHFVVQLSNIRTLFDIDLCFLLWETLLLQNTRLSCKVSLLYYLKFIAILSNLLQPNESVARFVHIMLRFLLLKALHIYKNHQITDFAWNWVFILLISIKEWLNLKGRHLFLSNFCILASRNTLNVHQFLVK